MGSGNSAPVERARTVETEAHQDVFEMRFDHLAFGGTSLLLIAAGISLCWYCRRRNKKKRRLGKLCQCQQHPPPPAQQTPSSPPMMVPMPMPMPMPPWYQMQPFSQAWGPPSTNEPGRFVEIQDPVAGHTQQPPPRSSELPPPRPKELPPPPNPTNSTTI